ncbi:MAG: HNH endonuclease, partial [Actinomycetota bacterium]|nr:HNH endonuclease [Actinomycetota bacterium]
ADRVDQLEALERLKSAAAAAQARIAEALDRSRHEQRPGASDASVGSEIGLARHESPHRGRELLGLARALVDDLPHTLAALERGDLNERRAMLIAHETRDLCASDRRLVDAEVAADADLATLGDRRLSWAVRRIVLRVDEPRALRRREKAVASRHVSGRLLGDGTGLISAIISDVHYAAIMTSLRQRATLERQLPGNEGDDRSHGQRVADLFVERLTGQATATSVPVTIGPVVSAETLFGDDPEPGEISGYGPVPATVARRIAGASPDQQTRIRQLLRLDDNDTLIAMDSNAQTFGGLADFVRVRDQVCRTPWCNGPIRHLDHITARRRGGPTSERNGQGLCENCNYVKESAGWRHQAVSTEFERHEVEIATPTGHTHRSRAPAAPAPDKVERRGAYIQYRPGVWSLVA